MFIHRFALAAAVVVLAGACSSASSSGPLGNAPSATQACLDLESARCQKLASCSPALLALRDVDEPTCEARGNPSCLSTQLAPNTAATPEGAENCATQTKSASCAAYLGYDTNAVCGPPTPGASATGAACTYSAQCQSTWCSIPKGSMCGTCAAVPVAGDDCTATENCGSSLFCGKNDHRCVPYGAVGGACDSDASCDWGLGCVMAKGAASGTCQPLPNTEGAPCDAKGQTAPRCDRSAGLWCTTSGACAKFSGYAKTGDPCGAIDPTTFMACSGGGNCVVPTGGAGKGACVGPSDVGGPCAIDGSGAGCAGTTPARCVTSGGAATGTCTKIDPSACK